MDDKNANFENVNIDHDDRVTIYFWSKEYGVRLYIGKMAETLRRTA
jgi:hypothetical protein